MGVFALLILVGTVIFARMSASETFIVSKTPPGRRSTILGVYFFTGMEGGGILTPVLGYAIDRLGFPTAFTIAGCAVFMVTLICAFCFGKTSETERKGDGSKGASAKASDHRSSMTGRSLHADDPLRRRDDLADDRRFIDPRRMHPAQEALRRFGRQGDEEPAGGLRVEEDVHEPVRTIGTDLDLLLAEFPVPDQPSGNDPLLDERPDLREEGHGCGTGSACRFRSPRPSPGHGRGSRSR